jgi:WD40 repeat protein
VDQTVRVWDVASGQAVVAFHEEQAAFGVAFSPDGSRLVSGSADQTVKLWAPRGNAARTVSSARGTNVAFSPDPIGPGTVDENAPMGHAHLLMRQFPWGHLTALLALLVLAVGARPVRAADEKPPPVLSLTGHLNEIYTVAFAPDGKHLASASNREMIVWDLSAGKELFTYRITGTNVFGLAFSPDGKRLSVGISRLVKVLDAATGKEESSLSGAAHFLFRMAYSPDGKRLAASGVSTNYAGELCVWDTATGKEVQRLGPQAAAVLNVAYSADGRRLATASGATTGTRPGDVTVWEADRGREVVTLRGHTQNVYGVAFSPDGRRVASASGNRGSTRAGEVKLWEVLTGQESLSFDGHTGPVFAVAFSPDGRLLATASGDGTVRLWETITGRQVQTLSGHAGVIYSAAFSPDGKRLASAGTDRTVRVWDVPAPRRAPAEALDDMQVRACWDDLRCDDARKAYRAVGLLATAPKEAVPFLRARVRPAAPLPGDGQKLLDRLLRDLDDDRFDVREQAGMELTRLGEAALPGVRKALAGRPSAEVRRRLETIIEALMHVAPSPERRAALRALEALEDAGTAEARGLLKDLAAGLPEATLTREAGASLGRLTRRGADR